MSRNTRNRSQKSELSSNDAGTAIGFLEQIERLGLETEEDFETKFPLTYAAFKAWGRDDKPALRVTSKTAGFWRGGLMHPAEAKLHDVETLTFEQIERILAEPMLIAELVEAPFEPVPTDEPAVENADAKD